MRIVVVAIGYRAPFVSKDEGSGFRVQWPGGRVGVQEMVSLAGGNFGAMRSRDGDYGLINVLEIWWCEIIPVPKVLAAGYSIHYDQYVSAKDPHVYVISQRWTCLSIPFIMFRSFASQTRESHVSGFALR